MTENNRFRFTVIGGEDEAADCLLLARRGRTLEVAWAERGLARRIQDVVDEFEAQRAKSEVDVGLVVVGKLLGKIAERIAAEFSCGWSRRATSDRILRILREMITLEEEKPVAKEPKVAETANTAICGNCG